MHGYRDITVLGRQDHFLASYRTARRGIARARYLRATLSDLPRVSIETVVVGLIAAFLIISTRTQDDSAGSLAVLGLFAYAALRIMPALNKVVNNLNLIRFGRAAVDDVQADLALPVPDVDDGAGRLGFNQELALQQVSFRYPGADQPTLLDLDLMIRKGESIGIVGATGAGKSTLVDLIVGLSIATSGSITVDGVDLTGRAPAWQRNIGMVSQQVFLLDDTLRRNIALGLPDDRIDEVRIREAVGLAQLDDFVASLPDSLDTMVGERGIRVSGGQRQRVAIARALYGRPSVLIFDEGTSALDNLTEAMLIEALAGLREDHTIITVAHRLSTVQDYDRIVFMRDGRIDDIGTFVELGPQRCVPTAGALVRRRPGLTLGGRLVAGDRSGVSAPRRPDAAPGHRIPRSTTTFPDSGGDGEPGQADDPQQLGAFLHARSTGNDGLIVSNPTDVAISIPARTRAVACGQRRRSGAMWIAAPASTAYTASTTPWGIPNCGRMRSCSMIWSSTTKKRLRSPRIRRARRCSRSPPTSAAPIRPGVKVRRWRWSCQRQTTRDRR